MKYRNSTAQADDQILQRSIVLYQYCTVVWSVIRTVGRKSVEIVKYLRVSTLKPRSTVGKQI